MWPWGRKKRERDEALVRAEAALREASAAFYEVELDLRRVEFAAGEIRRLADEGIGARRESVEAFLRGVTGTAASLNALFAGYFEDLDAHTPLERHETAEDLDRAALALVGRVKQFEEILVLQRVNKADIDFLFENIAIFHSMCAPLMRTAVDTLESAREELAALAADGVTSRPLERMLRETDASLTRLREGRTGTSGREHVASFFRRLHAEADDIRRRIRLARPLAAAFDES